MNKKKKLVKFLNFASTRLNDNVRETEFKDSRDSQLVYHGSLALSVRFLSVLLNFKLSIRISPIKLNILLLKVRVHIYGLQ